MPNQEIEREVADYSSMREDTIPTLFQKLIKRFGNRVALREKDLGIWKEYSWEEYGEHVKKFCLGLIFFGLEKEERVTIVSENYPEWLFADIAIQSAGAVTTGAYPTSPPHVIKYIVEHSGSRFVITGDQEQTDKLLEIKKELPLLKKIIVIDPKGLRHYADPFLITFEEVEKLGKALDEKEPELFVKRLNGPQTHDVAVQLYTSGNTGFPKGAMISHYNIIKMVDSLVQANPYKEGDKVVAYLPLCHGAERVFSLFISLKMGCVVNFAESIETVENDIYEIGPTVFFAVPKIWEKLRSQIELRLYNATWVKRVIYNALLPLGYRIARKRLEIRKKLPIHWLILYGIYYFLLARSIQDKLGLKNVRILYSGGAPISPEVLEYFHAVGIRIRELYGATELSGISVVHQGEDIKIGTTGTPCPGVELRISDEGEILIKSETVFVGYYKDPEATKRTIIDGWLHLGDMGKLDEDCHLIVLGRKVDRLIVQNEIINPDNIENKLRFSPYIEEAIALGDGRNFVSAIIQIEYTNGGNWCQSRNIPYTTYFSLTQIPEVRELIRKEIAEINEGLTQIEKVKKFVFLAKELDHDDDELTATRKVRRKIIKEKFGYIEEDIYSKGKGFDVH